LDKTETMSDSGTDTDIKGWNNEPLQSSLSSTEVDREPYDPKGALEKFALYGFQIDVPDNWRIEVNPKSTRKKGDVAFHSPKGNRFFISWGKLEDATSRFKTLEEHRDRNIKQIKKGQDVKQVETGASYEERISGHRVLFTELKAEVRQGMFGRSSYAREMWSAHLYCDNMGRYFVIYCLLRDPTEYEDYSKIFKSMAMSLSCH
jgi:hypothetical protein